MVGWESGGRGVGAGEWHQGPCCVFGTWALVQFTGWEAQQEAQVEQCPDG